MLAAALVTAPVLALADDTMPPAPYAYRQLDDPAKRPRPRR
jgi:cytochrome c-type biogenesis protein CcmH